MLYVNLFSNKLNSIICREMALEGLFPGEGQSKTVLQSNSTEYPKLSEMLNYILEQQPAMLDVGGTGDIKLLFRSKTYVAMIKFLLKCFEAETAQTNLNGDSEFLHSVERLCLLLDHAMAYEGSIELHASASKALITLGSHFPQVDIMSPRKRNTNYVFQTNSWVAFQKNKTRICSLIVLF